MANITELSAEQLRRAATIKEQIETLQRELGSILGGKESGNGVVASQHRRGPSPEAIERIRAAQKARWAKYRSSKSKAAKTNAKPKRTLSAAAKAKIAAAAKARWAKAKAAGKKSL